MAGMLSYEAGTSILHRMNPLVKIVLALGICVAAFVSTNLAYLLALLAFNVATGFVGGIGKRTLKLLFSLAAVCVFLFVLQLLFIRTGNPVFFFVTDRGLFVASLVVLRLMCAAMPIATMLALTQTTDLTNALVKIVHLPYKYAFAMSTSLRFVPIFMSEMASIMESQMARGVDFDTGNPFRKIKLAIPLCVPLLVTSVGKIEQAAMAAEMRGFYLRTRESGSKEYPFNGIDIATLLFTALCIVLAVII